MYERKYHKEDLASKCFLITGGAGFIGSNLAEYLLKYGAGKVRVLDNFSTGSKENLRAFNDHPSFEMMEGDIRDFNTCLAAMRDIDYVSHQAALGSVPRSLKDPLTTNEVNISGFLNVLVAARDSKVKRMVYAASSSTYGDHPGLPKIEDRIGNPLSPYAVTKLVNEIYAGVFSNVYQFHTIGLRYFNVFGPRQSPEGPYAAVIPLFARAAVTGERPLIYGDGEQSRDFTFVENAIQANIRAMMLTALERSEVVNIAYGAATTLNELWKLFSELESPGIKPIYNDARVGDVKYSLADTAKAKNLIGYEPEFNLETGLALTLNWYKENNYFFKPA